MRSSHGKGGQATSKRLRFEHQQARARGYSTGSVLVEQREDGSWPSVRPLIRHLLAKGYRLVLEAA